MIKRLACVCFPVWVGGNRNVFFVYDMFVCVCVCVFVFVCVHVCKGGYWFIQIWIKGCYRLIQA